MEIKHRIELVDLLRYYHLPLIGAELGVAEGLNSRDMLHAGMEKLYCVDNWEHLQGQSGDGSFPDEWHRTNYHQAMNRLKPYEGSVVVLKGMSHEMASFVPDDSLSLLYLDGDHSFAGVIKDLDAWFPKVINGGVVSGHDFMNKDYGVNAAINFFCAGRYKINIIPENNPNDASFWFRKL